MRKILIAVVVLGLLAPVAGASATGPPELAPSADGQSVFVVFRPGSGDTTALATALTTAAGGALTHV